MFKENANAAGISLISSWIKGSSIRSFSGIAYLKDSIVIGQEGFEKYCAHNDLTIDDFWDGRFSYFEQSGQNAKAATDFMGQDIVFYFNDGKNWAASNSFFYLAEFLAAQDIKLTTYPTVLAPYLFPTSFTQQLISDNTGIEEIKVLSATDLIQVDNGIFKIKKRAAIIPPAVSKKEYASRLVDYAAKWASISRSLLNAYPDLTKVDVTGGRDSRTVLALILAGKPDLSKINFCSNVQYTKDFEVSQALGNLYGFNIENRVVPYSKASTEAVYDLWKYGNLGVYYPVYMVGGLEPSDSLHFHGAGGGCIRDVYHGNFIDQIANKIPSTPELKLSFRLEYARCLKDWGLENVSQAKAGTVHYRSCRSRLHFGRNWYRNLFTTLVTPISSWELLTAAEALSDQERARAQIYCDLMLLCSPELAHQPFDIAEKSFSPETISSSPFAKSRPSLENYFTNFKIYAGSRKEVKSTQERSGVDFKKLLHRDIKLNADLARSINILPDNYAKSAADDINAHKSIIKAAQKASHLISIGEIVRLSS